MMKINLFMAIVMKEITLLRDVYTKARLFRSMNIITLASFEINQKFNEKGGKISLKILEES
jgi:hypothetical protein